MQNNMYITYEEPFVGCKFTHEQMESIYQNMVDKKEYQDFDVWISDMLKTGIFKKYTAENIEENELRPIPQLTGFDKVDADEYITEQKL